MKKKKKKILHSWHILIGRNSNSLFMGKRINIAIEGYEPMTMSSHTWHKDILITLDRVFLFTSSI